MWTSLSIIICVLSGADICSGSASRDLSTLHNEFFAWRMSDRPVTATTKGIHKYDDQLESFNMSMFDIRKEKAETLHARLLNISQEDLSKSDLVNYKILDDMLTTYIRGWAWRQYQNLNPISFMDGIQRNPSSFVNSLPFFTRGDFENYIARLQKMPDQYEEFKVLMTTAMQLNRTFHRQSMIRVEDQFNALMGPTNESVFYTPFLDTLDNGTVDPDVRGRLKEQGLIAVANLQTAIQNMQQFINDVYLPNTRPDIGISSLDGGQEYYEACIRWYLSVNMTAQEVHDIGLLEVDRIVDNMEKITKKQGFEGSVSEYFKDIMNDTRFFFNTAEEMIEEYEKQIFTVVEPELETYFSDMPGLPIEVLPTPNDGPIGSYSSGSADGSRPGIFWANVLRPESSPNLTMMALTIHEANPGHHLQISYSITSDTPDFRQKMESSAHNKVPFAFPRYTAFVEGWALYSEFLGEEMGLYRDDYELMGRYSSEMFRACRLVVDTGIHAFNWTRDGAIEYMLNYTARSYEAVAVEIDRYITWPGQALAYKIGEIKILELRRKAEQELGDRFDIREFHSVVLKSGTLPLTVLEDLVNDWLDSYPDPATPAPATPAPTTCGTVGLASSLVWVCGVLGLYALPANL
ncbi:uncharacterized protein LOC124119505 [Haliotis rufescens]|uniref:uncharacterized protein LOC124119505 n=1 Tax=Haliotis rufescens TaxID=6454 RepID=UPI00201F9D53|nr:uncharacterized protein LOC124119505 [Haliotis rufescens]